jgi:putative transposase
MAVSFKKYRMPDDLWTRMKPLLPSMKRSPLGGRPPRKDLRPIADAIFYKMRTGCQWNAIPRSFAPSSTVHDYFQRWVVSGIFERLWELALSEYDDLQGIAWKQQSLDVAIVKAPLGGEKNRSKSNGSRQAWMQTLRPGRRSWCALELRTARSKPS